MLVVSLTSCKPTLSDPVIAHWTRTKTLLDVDEGVIFTQKTEPLPAWSVPVISA